MKERSVGVTIIGLLFILLGLGGILVVLGAIQGLYLLITGIGVLMLKSWARWMALIGSMVSILIVVALAVMGGGLRGLQDWPLQMTGLVWSGLLIWYFLRPSVKAQFVSKGQ